MKITERINLLKIARILTVAFIVFISLFALDAFHGQNPFLKELAGFIIHLIPSFILIAILYLFWEKPLYTGILFLIIAVGFTFFFDLYQDPVTFLIIGLPPVIIGLLFLISYNKQKKNP